MAARLLVPCLELARRAQERPAAERAVADMRRFHHHAFGQKRPHAVGEFPSGTVGARIVHAHGNVRPVLGRLGRHQAPHDLRIHAVTHGGQLLRQRDHLHVRRALVARKRRAQRRHAVGAGGHDALHARVRHVGAQLPLERRTHGRPIGLEAEDLPTAQKRHAVHAPGILQQIVGSLYQWQAVIDERTAREEQRRTGRGGGCALGRRRVKARIGARDRAAGQDVVENIRLHRELPS